MRDTELRATPKVEKVTLNFSGSLISIHRLLFLDFATSEGSGGSSTIIVVIAVVAIIALVGAFVFFKDQL